MSTFDLVIRGATVVDGSGDKPVEADVAVSGGKIAEVGPVSGSGKDEIDARGHILTPGFVDVHTHYDGQATWASRLDPSSWHGVTTAVMGNCGVGFAPCRPDDHERLIQLMEGVEDIPEVVLTEGLKWDWETFPEFLDALDRLPHDMDFATQVPHGALRVYVMGARGADREPATADDIARMAQLTRQGIEAGALGFSTSRTLNHRTSTGDPTPTLTAEAEELVGIARSLQAAGQGVLQVVSDFRDPESEFSIFRDMSRAADKPLSISIAQTATAPEAWRRLLHGIGQARAEGIQLRGQVAGRPVGVLLGLDLSLCPFSAHSSYQQIAERPFAERVAALRDPDFRARLLNERPDSAHPFMKAVLGNFDKIFLLGDPPDYEPTPEKSIGRIAQSKGVSPFEVALDAVLENEGHGMLYFPFLNYASDSLDPSYEMMRDANTIMGLGDGGAHVGMICDSSFTTSLLTHWTRDRTRGPKLDLEWVVKAHTRDNARAMGLFDRGLIKPGYKADMNIIDYDNLKLHPPEIRHDLPAGGRRLVQRAEGYTATLVSGQVTYRNGTPTQALPGRLIRGPQPAPRQARSAAD